MNISDPKRLTPPPRTRMCHVCGRQYGMSSFDIHIRQCKDLWVAREALKDKRDRKDLPQDPPNLCVETELDEINRLANEIYNTVSLDTCEFCGRSFLIERLLIHNRSCTADNPAKRLPFKKDPHEFQEVSEKRGRASQMRPKWTTQKRGNSTDDCKKRVVRSSSQTNLLAPRRSSTSDLFKDNSMTDETSEDNTDQTCEHHRYAASEKNSNHLGDTLCYLMICVCEVEG